jgi:hypothetical protein
VASSLEPCAPVSDFDARVMTRLADTGINTRIVARSSNSETFQLKSRVLFEDKNNLRMRYTELPRDKPGVKKIQALA